MVTPYAVHFDIALSSSADFTVIVATALEAQQPCLQRDAPTSHVRMQIKGFVTITIIGNSNQSVLMKTTKASETQYIQYGYRVGIVPGEAWEGSGLLLKTDNAIVTGSFRK